MADPADVEVRPYGSWPSPLGAADVVAAGVGLGGPIVADDGALWWSESRPQEGGRIQLVRRSPDGMVTEVLPEGWSARTRVHEYGGGAWWVTGTTVFFASWADQRLHRLDLGGAPVPLTPEPWSPGADRYADGVLTPDRRWILCVRERHPDPADGGADPASASAGGDGRPVEPRNEIVAVPATPPERGEPVEPVVVVSGPDFVSHPRIDPSGRFLSWLAWHHPDMPWDATELWVADLVLELGDADTDDETAPPGSPAGRSASGASAAGGSSAGGSTSGGSTSGAAAAGGAGSAPRVHRAEVVLGGPGVSVAQPTWAPDGRLTAVADVDGWWNLWEAPVAGRPAPGSFAQRSVVEGELAQPQWVFGQSWYGHVAGGAVVGSWRFDGTDHLGVLTPGAATPRWLDVPFTSVTALDVGADGTVAVVASSFDAEAVVATLEVAALHADGPDGDATPGGASERPGVEGAPAPDPGRSPAGAASAAATRVSGAEPTGGTASGRHDPPLPATVHVVRPARDLGIDPAWWSVPEPIDFPTSGGRTAHALWYPPRNPTSRGPEGEAPPLLVLGHGGPTAAARPQIDLAVQYWTTRGWGVVDVNYGGSTGYGRPYRRQLDGQWGVVDVDDLCAAAEHLARRGDADPRRLAVKGGSAGGFTVLAALAFRDTFAVGACRYGIADLEALARDTHKFESRYTDGLVAPYPEGRDLYVERSPIHHLEAFDTPLLVLQGLEDAVVPPNQSEAIVAALEAKGVPVAYLAFEGEQHGFRRAETILRALEAEHYVLSEVLGLVPADHLEPVEIRWGPTGGETA